MDPLMLAALMPRGTMSVEAHSALPNAPVVEHVEPAAPMRRARSVAATMLYRLGDVVAPRRAVPVRRALG